MKTAKVKRAVLWMLTLLMTVSALVMVPETTATAATAGQLREGTDYVIVSKKSGKALTVENYSKDNRAKIVQMSLNNYESQVWTLDYDDKGYYQIINKFSGKVLDVPWSSTEDGVQAEQYDKGEKDNQKWKITDVSGGYCRISPKIKESLALNVEGNSTAEGASIIQWPYNGKDNEVWEIREVSRVNANPQSNNTWNVISPDNGTKMTVKLSGDGKLTYTVEQDGVMILENSEMGINTSVGDFTKGLSFRSEENKTINEKYSMLSGKRKTYTNYCKEKTLHFSKNGVNFDVVVRAYNDGIAFRYKITTANGQKMTVNPGEEKTSFNLPNGAQLWYMNRTKNSFMYEERYETGEIGKLAEGILPSMPTLFRTNKKLALITEADRHGTYVGSLLKLEGDGVLRTIFDLTQTKAISTNTPFTSPWRTVVIGSENDIVQNTMVENLSPAPNEKYDFESWVEPGVSSWSWVSYYGGQEDPQIHKNFIDLAADMGWEYYILDEKWQPKSNKSGSRYAGMWDWFGEVRDYAKSKGVKLIAWVDKSDVDTDEEREARFKEWSLQGIVGIKVDFFYNDSQAMIQLQDDIYADAAKYKLMVNVHGANPPSGEIRTYPNVIAREAIFGQEQGGITAEQYTLIPFIRAAVGTADVTEQLYSRDTSKTTMGFQIALSTLIENGIRSLGSKPEEYYSIPEAINYYTNFPTDWDDLFLINASVGSNVNLARKSGDAWYAAGISVEERDFNYKPAFLDANKTYTAVFFVEKENERQDLEIKVKNNVTRDTNLSAHVAAGGGYAVKFIPQGGLKSVSTQNNVTLDALNEKYIKLTFSPSNTNATDVIWSVADPSVAKVSNTGVGATIKGLKKGTTTVTATSIYDESIKASVKVTVNEGKYSLNTANWQIINNDAEYEFNGENAVTIEAQTGVISRDVFAMKVPQGTADFEITAKISGTLNANYQGGFIGVFTQDLNGYASVGRRYHTMFNSGGSTPNNHISMMSNNRELYARDTDVNKPVYVRLVKKGNDFIGYYRYNESDGWTQTNTITHASLAQNEQLYVGFYAGCGGLRNATKVTFSDFKFNGKTVKLANTNTTNTGVEAGQLKEGKNYIIVSKRSGKALTVESYVKAENARIIQMPVTNCESQVWTLDYDDNGYYQIVNKYSGKSMNVPWASKDAGVEIIQFGKGNGDNEKWKITDVGNGYCRITPKLVPEFGLNIEGGSRSDGGVLIQWEYEGKDNEIWEFREVTDIKANPVWNEKPNTKVAIDSYLDKFFYVENGLGKLRNEPSNGFWTDAEILEVFIDAYEHLGDKKYLTAAEQFFDGIVDRRGTNWAWNGFNDDVMWMSIASVRLYLHTGEAKHLNAAIENFNLTYDRAWSNDLGGGLWWTTDNREKNACVNSPGGIAACFLGKATGDKSYYDKAIKIWNWEYDVLYDKTDGSIADNIKANGEYIYWDNTGNQGCFAGFSTMLYEYTKDKKYLEVAEKALDLAAKMGDGAEGYLNREANSGDSIGGKGLLGRWMGYYAEVSGNDKYNDWMMRNAIAAWYNRNSDNLMWGAFGRKTVDDIENNNKVFQPDNKNVTMKNYAAWGCASAVAWILNGTELEVVKKPGEQLEEMLKADNITNAVFEMENGALSGSAGIVTATGSSNGKHVGNVGGANKGTVSYQISSTAATKGKLSIYYATLNDRSLQVVVNGKAYNLTCPKTGNWTNIGAPVTLEADFKKGVNNVQFTGVDGAYAPNLDKFEIELPKALRTIEAESGTLSGGALTVNDTASSGGKYVGDLGGANNGTTTLKVVSDTAGKRNLKIYYATLEARDLRVVVNGKAQTIDCKGTGDWGTIGEPIQIEITLQKGNNTIALTGADGAYAPNVDRVELPLTAVEAATIGK